MNKRLPIDPFTKAEREEIRRAEDYRDMSYVDSRNHVRYQLSHSLVEEEILELMYVHGWITDNQMAGTLAQIQRESTHILANQH